MAIFTGAGVAIITPMMANGDVDFPMLEKFIDFQIENGTDCIVITGTTGEASTLTHEEHIETIRCAVDAAKKRVPVVAGTGSNCTETAIYLSKEAERVGADGVLLVSPYYNKATQRGLYEHFADTAHAINIPVILYNIQGRTGVNIAPSTVASLVKDVDNIVGIKEASGDISQIADIMQLTDGQIDLYSGNDDQVVPLMSLGGKGVISVLSNIAPRETHDMVQKFLDGDVKGSLELQMKYLPLIHALFSEVNPIPVKKAVSLIGYCQGAVRKPLTVMEEAHAAVLMDEMKKVGLI
ncbi:4-hydroxy-tetrahydrodipicolinate synthase [Anaerolentibacter hominis]|uniref:4-hydroxy-tetrahydrodipicolinate synthase n=1 Tax=Anaerolentibacter hominis TaxID=3079009 RepID=UPI0031B85964